MEEHQLKTLRTYDNEKNEKQNSFRSMLLSRVDKPFFFMNNKFLLSKENGVHHTGCVPKVYHN